VKINLLLSISFLALSFSLSKTKTLSASGNQLKKSGNSFGATTTT